jgi:hypothetical protein
LDNDLSIFLNIDFQGNLKGERLATIPEVEPILEEINDSFEVDEDLLNDKMRRRLFRSRNSFYRKKKGEGKGGEDSELDQTTSIQDTLSLDGSFDLSQEIVKESDEPYRSQRSSLNPSTYLNLSKMSSEYLRNMKQNKRQCYIRHDSRSKSVWDNFLAVLIVKKSPYKNSLIKNP